MTLVATISGGVRQDPRRCVRPTVHDANRKSNRLQWRLLDSDTIPIKKFIKWKNETKLYRIHCKYNLFMNNLLIKPYIIMQ